MSATRNFRLDGSDSVLVPRTFGPGIARRVIAGEACTELGSESSPKRSPSWIERWLNLSRAKSSARL